MRAPGAVQDLLLERVGQTAGAVRTHGIGPGLADTPALQDEGAQVGRVYLSQHLGFPFKAQ